MTCCLRTMDTIRKKYKNVTGDQSDRYGLTGWQYRGSTINGSYSLQKNAEEFLHLPEEQKKQPASMLLPVSHLHLESFLYMKERILLI